MAEGFLQAGTSVRRSRTSNQLCRGVLGTFVTIAVLLAAASPAVADLWYQHYQKAREALERQQWETAIGELNQAIERRGDSGARVRTYGMRTTDYFPYLDLGLAYLELNQPEAALRAFETEERLGAIEEAPEALQRLRTGQERAQSVLEQLASEERERIDQIVGDSIDQAESLRAEGQLDEAMVALGRGLAVAPENPAANALMEQLRLAARRRDERRELEEQVERLVAEGSDLFQSGALEEAANRFRRALNLDPENSEISGLLTQTQDRLRDELQQKSAAGGAVPEIRESLSQVSQLERDGELDRALTLLQSVLALDPENEEARALEARLVGARDLAEREAGDRAAADAEISVASEHLAEGRFEEALTAANRALAYAPNDPVALGLVAKSYQEISRVLLGRNLGGDIPPAIRFADFREETDDGALVQIVRQPRFRLTGMVIDNSPVEVSFSDSQDNRLPVEIDLQQLGDFYLTEFQIDVDLAPGLEVLRVVATDIVDLSASSEYSVLYLRPRLRSPAFLAALSLALLGLGALLLVRRSRRLARRRHRRFNPYVAGAPVLDEHLFFGRDQLLNRILQTIHNNSLLLYGERRIGKTSIQHHLKRRLLELSDPIYDFFPVYIDLQGTPEERFFATIADDVFQQLGDQIELPEQLTFEDEAAAYSYRDLVRDLRGVIRQLEAGSSKKVKLVLLIDEVDELNDYDPRINQRLRSLFMKSFAESLVAVVSGVEIKKHWERVGSPWYNFFEEIEVLPLSDAEARRLIERPISGVLKIGDGVVERILEITGRRPYPIQKICISLVNHAYEQRKTVISLADVEAVASWEAA